MSNNDQRSNIKKDLFILIPLIFICTSVLIFSDFGKNRTVVYDCRDAHWHPDFPIEVKEECRRLIKEELEKIKKKEQEKRLTEA